MTANQASNNSSQPSHNPADHRARKVLGSGKYMQLVKIGNWEFAERHTVSGAVVIVAVTRDGRLLLTEQHRVPVDKRVIELPAGLVGDLADAPDEDFATAARRELLEETGYQARSVNVLAEGPISAGFGTEWVVFCRASGLKKMTEGGGDQHEQIQVHKIPLASVQGWLRGQIAAGRLVDPKIYAGLYFAGASCISRRSASI